MGGGGNEFASTPQRLVLFAAEDSPRGLGRTLGKRVGGNPSRVRISYPPPVPHRALTSKGPAACSGALRRCRSQFPPMVRRPARDLDPLALGEPPGFRPRVPRQPRRYFGRSRISRVRRYPAPRSTSSECSPSASPARAEGERDHPARAAAELRAFTGSRRTSSNGPRQCPRRPAGAAGRAVGPTSARRPGRSAAWRCPGPGPPRAASASATAPVAKA